MRALIVLLLAAMAHAETSNADYYGLEGRGVQIDASHPGYVPVNERVDCHPEPGANQTICTARGCTWSWDSSSPGVVPNSPACFYPPHTGYSLIGSVNDSPLRLRKAKGAGNPYGKDAPELVVAYSHYVNPYTHTSDIMMVAIAPPDELSEARSFRSKHNMMNNQWKEYSAKEAEKLPKLELKLIAQVDKANDNFFSFKIVRNANGRVLFDTSIGGLLYAEQYKQIAAYLPSRYMYGWGEHNHDRFMRNLTAYSNWPMWSRDQAPDPNKPTQNLYGVHPFYLMLEGDGNAHGIAFGNVHAQEVGFGPAPHLTYRTLGGHLSMHIFSGSSPDAVIGQYLSFFSVALTKPPYWAFGFMLCRYGYHNLTEVENTVLRQRAAGIPQDVQFVDIDYMRHHEDFTYNHRAFAGLPEFVDALHMLTMKNILITDPAIGADYSVFRDGLEADAFITWPKDVKPPAVNQKYNASRAMLGKVWPPVPAAFPDFLRDNTANFWSQEIMRFHKTVHFDGLWIDMNEPSNFGTNINGTDYNHLMCPVALRSD